MYKKFFVASILCMGLLAFAGIKEAKAWPTTTGWGWNPGSIECYSDWKGIGNPEINPTSAVCNGFINKVLINCITNGGGTGGVGLPFDVEGVDVSGEDFVLPDSDDGIDGRGLGSASIYFSDSDLIDSLAAAGITPEDVCQNKNWDIDPNGGVTVLNAFVQIIGFDDDVAVSELWGECTLNTEAGVYDCTTYSNNKIK